MKDVAWKIRSVAMAGIILCAISFSAIPAQARIIFQNDDFANIPSSSIIINGDDEATGDIVIQFGMTLGEALKWSSANTRFEFSNNLDLNNNQLSSVRIENITALPGGAGGLGAEGTGRIVELTVTDSVAPGCTATSCPPGMYSWDGSAWKSLHGSTTSANEIKIVTVGPSGRDYTSISAAATYLNGLTGGEMWVDPGSYAVTSAINLSNIKIRGADTGLTTLAISGGGKFNVINSKFATLTINIDSGLTAGMGLDVTYSASMNSALDFERVNFIVGGSKYAIGSTSATAPVTYAVFNQCSQTSGTGSVLAAVASSNLNAGSSLTVMSLLNTSPLKISNWPVTVVGGSNVITSGTVTTVPERTILVSPSMNIQSAVTSLGSSGGTVKLLVGTHDVTTSLTVANDNIVIVGEGPATILRAQSGTWTGGTGSSDAVIQVGASNGTTPRNGVHIKNFTLQVGPDIQGVRVNGGSENKVTDMVVRSIGTKSTPGPRAGIVFTDGSASAGRRFVAARNIINSDSSANRWVDGIHIDGGTEATLSGQLFGYGNGIFDSSIYENVVSEAKQTSFAFTDVYATGIYSNRARDMGWDSGALGLFVNNSRDVNVINNSIDGNHNTGNTGIVFYSDVVNSVVIGNTVRGSVGTCSPPGSTDCLLSIGVNISGTVGGNSANNVTDNQINAVSTVIQDNGANSKLESNHHRAAVNPTATDDISKGYGIGTIWINTATAGVYISVNSSVGAAVWSSLGGGSGHTQNTDTGTTSSTFTLDSDDTGGDVSLVFGTANNKVLKWDSVAGELSTVNAGTNIGTYLKISGGTAITGHLSAIQTNFISATIAGRACGDYGTITVTGAAVGDQVAVTPTPVTGGIETVNFSWNGLVTAADTVTIRACNTSTSTVNTPDTQTWRADVWKH